MASSLDEVNDEAEMSAHPVEEASAIEEGAGAFQEASGRRDDRSFSLSDGDSQSRSGDSDDKDEDDRENRFQGPSSTWHKYTANERGLTASLAQERADNLSIHLYNVHAYKARLRDSERAAAAKPWQSKSTWLSRDENEKLPWHPHSRWAAWPLSVDDVPRKEEGHGQDLSAVYDEETYRKSEPWRPSQDLEEELQALMLRKAKQQSRRRTWVEGQDPFLKPQHHREDSATKAESGTDGEEKPNNFSNTVYQRPDLLADDDEAHEILKPTIQHMMAKLDDLLTGLHKSRAGMRKPSSAKSRAHSKPSQSRSRSQSHAKPSRSSSRRLKSESINDSINDCPVSDNDDEAEAQSENSDASIEAQPKRTSRPSGPSNHELGQRDWSDVLGMAAMTGWDPAVIDRAARRCASLFGETMSFRVMPETTAGNLQDEIMEYQPDMAPLTDSENDVEEENRPLEDFQYFCPYETCRRHYGAFTLRWRWRQHLQREHDLSKQDVAKLEQQLKESVDSGEAPNFPLADEDDKRDDAAGRSQEEDDDSDADLPGDSGDGMLGAVHQDGFMLPITGQLGRGKALKPMRRRRSTAGEAIESPPKRQRLDDDENGDDFEEVDAET